MSGADEILLVVVGLGVAGFGLAAMLIVSAAAEDAIRRHMAAVRAMQLRNAHFHEVLSTRGGDAPDLPASLPTGAGAAREARFAARRSDRAAA